MKIIMCPGNLEFGGGGVLVKNLLQRLPRYKEIEEILLLAPEEPLQKYKKTEVRTVNEYGKYFITKEPSYALNCRKALKKISLNDYDLIHLHRNVFFDFRKDNLPVVSMFHITRLGLSRPLLNNSFKTRVGTFFHRLYLPSDRYRARISKKIICPSIATKEELFETCRNNLSIEEKTSIIPYGIDSKLFRPFSNTRKEKLRKKYDLDGNKKIILYVGRLDIGKGINYLIDAVKNEQSMQLGIAGDGPLRKELENVSNIKLLGSIPHSNLPEIYNIADVFVLPSLQESFGIVAVEAIACGIPIIVSNVCELPRIIEGCGIAVEPANPAAIKKAIYSILENGFKVPENRRKQVLRQYDWEVIAKKTLGVYKEAIE